MKLINSKIHGILDYVLVFMLSVTPFIFNFEEESIHCRLLMVTGLLLLLTSLLTDFEFFLVKIFTFKTHLFLDILLGVFLSTSPLFFNLSGFSVIPHVTLGLLIITSGIVTKRSKEPVMVSQIQEDLHNEIIAQD